jgi:Family of unknown function (DUF5906)
MTNLPDFKAFCEAACIKLWGEPNGRTKKELRWKNGSDNSYGYRSFNLRKRIWYDADQQRGGSTLELVAYAKGEPAGKLRGAAFFEAWQYAYEHQWVPDPPPPPKAKGGGKPIIATYPYPDEQGELLFEVVRFDTTDPDERFSQRQPDGNGGWTWDIKGVRRVLYRLPELIAAVKAGERVLVCEGEKDANTAMKLGYAATTMPGGVNKWRAEYDAFFAGADVVIVSDNDPQLKDPKTGKPQVHPDGRPVLPGQDHAEKLAKRLAKVAARVRKVMFEVKDLTDWVTGGGTREQLDALIEQAPQYKARRTEPELPPPPPPGIEGEHARLLAELNENNCVVLDGAKTMVLRFEEVEHVAGGERYVHRVPTFLRFHDFRNFYLNRRVQVGKRWIDLGSWWLEHWQRRQYRGVIFRPAGAPVIDGRLNLWTGWSVEPKQGDWSLLRKHIFETVAAGDERVRDYVLNWMAWAVQHPDQQAEVALISIGALGSGKGTLGKALLKIFGQHALHISSPEHLTGRFNAHLRQCCFLFADEAYGPKDKSAEGTLKRLITEDTLTIEQKGRDPIEVPNLLHVMMASNNEWVIPAGAHERRFMVQRVSEAHRQDPAWFGPLYRQMREGGYGAMLFDLLRRDLGDWHPRDVVRTAALVEQQEESLSPFDAWWFELLQTGELAGADDNHPDQAISNEYEEDEDLGSDGYGASKTRVVKREGLYDQARRVSPKLKGITDAALGRYLSDRDRGSLPGRNDRGCKPIRVRRRGKRHRGWQFPSLAECRARWLERFPDTKWHDPDLEDWTTGED